MELDVRGRDAELAQVIASLRDWGVETVYLFGSWARGEEDSLSDIDLVVIRRTETSFLERFVELSRQLPKQGRAVDALVYTPEEFAQMREQGNALVETVLEEGRIVYARTA